MKQALKNIFPYFITILLWAMPSPSLNPFGALCLMPIFYYGFAEPRPHWTAFGLLMSFLLDASAGTIFLFSAVYLVSMSVNAALGIFTEASGIRGFLIYTAAAMALMFFTTGLFSGGAGSFLVGLLWLEALLLALYIPAAALFGKFR
ncbi:MAG: hypothetical protein LBL46_02495 [Rickettsiales bacterium]|jgi:hypothetical protein|nr:hypothetical protein [Rickettsiales bacterium]